MRAHVVEYNAGWSFSDGSGGGGPTGVSTESNGPWSSDTPRGTRCVERRDPRRTSALATRRGRPAGPAPDRATASALLARLVGNLCAEVLGGTRAGM